MKNTPFNVMRHRDWDTAPRGPAVVTYVGSVIFGGGVLTAGQMLVATILVNVAVTAVTSWALKALAPDIPSAVGTRGLLTNIREPAAPHQYVYGEVRKGGVITYIESTGNNNKFLHQIIVLAGHEVEEIGDIYINDEVVTFATTYDYEIDLLIGGTITINGATTQYDVSDNLTASQINNLYEEAGSSSFVSSSGTVTSVSENTTDLVGGQWNSKIRIQKFDGSQITAPDDLVDESNQVNSSFVGNGIAYLYVRLSYDQDVFANGIPLFTAKVKGKKVFDPRTSTTGYSANAALCVRDYLVSDYGMADTDSIDDTVFSAAANVCDETVNLDGGGTEKRYEMNGVISASLAPGDILQSMMTSCAGTLFWGQGKWQLRPGYYTAPTKNFTLDDLRGPISLSTRTSRRDNFNIVRGTFNDAEQRYITSDYPELRGDAFVTEDNNIESALDLELPFTTSAAMAQRLAKLTLFRGREQMAFSADFGLSAFDTQVGDIISLTNPRYGWVEKEFEVLGWRFFADGDAGDLRVNLSLRETSEAAFDWDAEESAIISNNTNLLSYTDVPTLGIPAGDIIPSLRIAREKLTEVITINVTTGRPEAVDRVEVQFAKAGTSDWKSLGSGGLGTYEAVDLEPDSYKFRARAINSFGYFGSYTETGSVQTAGSAAPPQDVEGLFYEVSEGTTTLEWEPVPDLDLSFYRIRHAVEQTGATWANSTTAVDKVPRPGTSVALPTRPGSYLIRAYDKTGIASQNYTTVTVSEDEVPSFTRKLTQQEDSGFTGDRIGCELSGTQLQITDPSTAPSEATYDFSTYIETHDNTARRVRARVDAAVFRSDESAGLWDDLPGLFDDLPGLFDDFTGTAQFADTNLLFYISTTPDDPTVTPTWSEYKQFRAGEFYGRAFRFRVVLKSNAANVTPAITALSAIVEYN